MAEKKTFSDPVTTEEIDQAYAKVAAEEEKPAEAPAAEPKTEEPLAEPGEAKPEEIPAEPPSGTYVDVGGKRYTREDIIELQRGSLRQEDYTERTQFLQEQRRLNEERASLLAEREAIVERYERGGGTEDSGEEETDAERDEKLSATDRRLLEVRQEQQRIRDMLYADRRDRADETVNQIFRRTVNDLHEKHKVPEYMRPLVESRVLDIDPQVGEDEGLLPHERIERNIRDAYLEAVKPVGKYEEDVISRVTNQIRGNRPKPAPPVGGGPAPTPQATERKPPGEWDTHKNTLEVMEHMKRVLASGTEG